MILYRFNYSDSEENRGQFNLEDDGLALILYDKEHICSSVKKRAPYLGIIKVDESDLIIKDSKYLTKKCDILDYKDIRDMETIRWMEREGFTVDIDTINNEFNL